MTFSVQAISKRIIDWSKDDRKAFIRDRNESVILAVLETETSS